ncbi:MAG: hypothetical protein HY785_29365 [Oscillatoriophycideae cyanobacterium NC_groundwater_1537_Pr4_S-0.65um_50_18]|nr:hypothetical protein [Oscillatoriophycideae cyanobacterium NC_groundwater_1537_Pr4_S-0.65um_50_18]
MKTSYIDTANLEQVLTLHYANRLDELPEDLISIIHKPVSEWNTSNSLIGQIDSGTLNCLLQIISPLHNLVIDYHYLQDDELRDMLKVESNSHPDFDSWVDATYLQALEVLSVAVHATL